MKIQILTLSIFFLFSGKIKAQNDFITENMVSKNKLLDLSRTKENEKFAIVSFIHNSINNNSQVKINSVDDQLLKVRIFNMNGEMAREDSYLLQGGISDLQLDFNNLASGHYMVQFYTTNGSEIRRFVKM